MCLPELKIGRIKTARCYEYLKINRLKVKMGKTQKGPSLLMNLLCGPDGTRTRDLRRDRAAF